MRSLFLSLFTSVLSLSLMAEESVYDPLQSSKERKVEALEFSVKDEIRHREIPVLVHQATNAKKAPVILFSHGLGGSREGNEYLNPHLARRGYVIVMMQHPGSDSSVWQGVPLRRRFVNLQKAASLENFLLRVQDVKVVLDQLEQWNKTEGHALYGKLDLAKVGMSGHSFGAVTTQAVSGQTASGSVSFHEPRIKAALAYSPSPPQRGDVKQAFGSVKIPWMLMTGTDDDSAIGRTTPEMRREVYKALPAGGKYELVLEGGQHSAFTDRPLPNDKKERNPKHHRSILALSTAFWDTWLAGNPQAKAWLHGEGPRSVLEAKDIWQKK